MAISGDRSLLEQQILSNSGLKGQELEALKTRLAALSEKELQAELSKQISGGNYGEWYEGIVLEHSDSVVQLNNYDKETYTDEDGNEVTEYKDGDDIVERIIKSTDEKGNVYETTVTFSGGKPLSQTKTKNGNKTEASTYEYSDNDGVSFVTIQTEKSDKSKTTTTALEVDKNGDFDQFGENLKGLQDSAFDATHSAQAVEQRKAKEEEDRKAKMEEMLRQEEEARKAAESSSDAAHSEAKAKEPFWKKTFNWLKDRRSAAETGANAFNSAKSGDVAGALRNAGGSVGTVVGGENGQGIGMLGNMAGDGTNAVNNGLRN